MKTFKLGELFAGPGGLAWGAIHAEVESCGKIVHAWANDCDSATCDTYRKNICLDTPDSVICCDVRDLHLNSLAPIDALAFGFPCNDFSIIGKQRGLSGKYGLLYRHAVDALKKFQPDFFVAENVRGLAMPTAAPLKNKFCAAFMRRAIKFFRTCTSSRNTAYRRRVTGLSSSAFATVLTKFFDRRQLRHTKIKIFRRVMRLSARRYLN